MAVEQTPEERQASFEEAAKPLIKWLCDNMHPHSHVLVHSTCAELVEGSMVFNTEQFVKD